MSGAVRRLLSDRRRLGRLGGGRQRHLPARVGDAPTCPGGLVDRAVLLEITGRSEDERQPLNGVTRAINSVSHTLADEGLVGDDFLLTWPAWKRGTAVSFEANPGDHLGGQAGARQLGQPHKTTALTSGPR